MKVKWRTHELILVTVTFIGFCLSYAWHQLNPEQLSANQHYAEIFSGHHLVFSVFSNQILPEAGMALLCYLLYLWVNLSIVLWLWPRAAKKKMGRGKKVLALFIVFAALTVVCSAAFIGYAYLKEEWRYHYPGFSIFYKGHNSHDNINLSDIVPIALLIAVFLTYISLREIFIRFLEKPGTNRNYRIMIMNQVTIFIGAYLLFLLMVQFVIHIDLFDLITRLNIIPLPAVFMGFIAIYYLFPAYEGKPVFYRPLLQRLALWSFLLCLPIPFLIPGSPLIIFPFAWLFQLLVIIPVSGLLYQQQKDHILAFRGLEKDLSRSKADLQFLRSQINPHFLFNTLNTIYASALEEDANRTAKCLQMLGDMMRFMLDENLADRIPLYKEINYIKNYISLQQLRLPLSDKMVIELHISADEENQQIVPMLMIPLIENAFKYGVSMQDPSFIRINLTASKGILNLEVRNSIHHNKMTDTEGSQSGIGLNNVRNRLELVYPGKYRFSAGQAGEQYTAQLTIEL
jgi:two-component system LytT family sensor kinase